MVAPVGMVSSIGTRAGLPYTVADELNTIENTPAAAISSNKTRLPETLLS